METNKPATLCWSCANACGKCSWSDESFTPVPGWKAKKTRLRVQDDPKATGRYTESYIVEECQMFDDDTQKYNKPTKRNKWNSAPYLQEVTA